MTVGFVMLVHEGLYRAEQVARHVSRHGCPVVIHVDARVPQDMYQPFVDSLCDIETVKFSTRHACEWGTWSLVGASQDASELMLDSFPDVGHVYLMSGSCLPLRPIEELIQYLAERSTTDFIESVTTEDVPWTIGGLDGERFTRRFPFSWKRQRALFDGYVNLQRKIGYKRKIPQGLVPHLGSQWWCLTRDTLSKILKDPERQTYDDYFKKVWIPDESYYQTLIWLHAGHVESRSLTLSKFDYQGKPHILYDDHLQLLRRSDCFIARKVWKNADLLYETFLNEQAAPIRRAEPNPGKIERVFAKAAERRVSGREGLYMQSRQPALGKGSEKTSAPYSVFEGFSDLFEDFEPWLSQTVSARVHGHLYAEERAEFSGGKSIFSGAMSDHAALRDYDPCGFLTNLIWNTRGERQCFMYGPRDNQKINWLMAKDPNAQISIISGAWAVPLFRSGKGFSDVRCAAARLQKIEAEHLKILRSEYVRASVRVWTMADFIEVRADALQEIIEEIGLRDLTEAMELPQMRDLTGFGQFLQHLKNEGMHPHLMGEFPMENTAEDPLCTDKKPYRVKLL